MHYSNNRKGGYMKRNKFYESLNNEGPWTEKTANLIELAPELLEAVKELIQTCIQEGNWETKQAKRYLDLIAKAEGKKKTRQPN
jgi:hypothetical protein